MQRLERTSGRRNSPVASTSSSSKPAYYADPRREKERLQREHEKNNRSPSRRRSRSPYRNDRRSRSRSAERNFNIQYLPQYIMPHPPFPPFHPMMPYRFGPLFPPPYHHPQYPGMFGPRPYYRPRHPNYGPPKYP